jgi:transcriptional regulator NrdR family protein
MLKYILLSTVMQLNITYPSADVCNAALEHVLKNDSTAICIPAGIDKHNDMMNNFMKMVQELQSTATKESKE